MIRYGIYRYIDKKTKEVLYVGKTDSNLDNRINAHKSESKFKGIDADIEYIELKNVMETRIYEFYFINLWKPILNVSDKYDDELIFPMPDVKWIPYKPEEKVTVRKKSTEEQRIKKEQYIKEWIEEARIEGYLYENDQLPINGFSENTLIVLMHLFNKYYQTKNKYIDISDAELDIDNSEVLIGLEAIYQNSILVFESTKVTSYNYMDYMEKYVYAEKTDYKILLNDFVVNWLDKTEDR